MAIHIGQKTARSRLAIHIGQRKAQRRELCFNSRLFNRTLRGRLATVGPYTLRQGAAWPFTLVSERHNGGSSASTPVCSTELCEGGWQLLGPMLLLLHFTSSSSRFCLVPLHWPPLILGASEGALLQLPFGSPNSSYGRGRGPTGVSYSSQGAGCQSA